MTQKHRHSAVVEESSAGFGDAIVAAAPDAIIVAGSDGTIVEFNPMAEHIFGRARADVVGTDLFDALTLATHRNSHRTDLSRLWSADSARFIGRTFPAIAMRGDGRPFAVEVSANVVPTERDLVVLFVRDRSTNGPNPSIPEPDSPADDDAAVWGSREMLAIIMRSAPGIVFAVDLSGVIRVSTGSGLAALGFQPGQLVGTNVFEIYKDMPEVAEYHRRALRGEEFRAQVDIGDRSLETLYRPIFSASGRLVGTVGVSDDITVQVQALRALRELADTDTITGLSSRARAEDLLATTLQQGKPLSVLVIDLDEFKDINDSHGHAIGDLVLERVGARLRETIPAESIIGRLGGDELVVGLLTGERGEAGRLATKILAAIARPLQLDLDDSGSVAIDLSITASIGIAVAPRDGGTAHELLGHADSAMYAAKRSGRASHRFYRTETDIASRRLLVSTRLRRAVDADDITVAYQPIVDLQSKRIIGFEALARWTDSQLGRVQPDEFIALAENTPLIDDLFDRVLQQALRAAVTWNSGLRTGTAVALGVNLAARQLTDPKLPKRIANAARAARFPLAALRMEITETAMMNHATARKVLGELSAAGIGLVIDDYGVGFSNIDVLTDLSRAGVLSSVKFDRSLVADLPTTRSRTLLSTFLGFATALDVTPVVEGIETAEQLAVLLEVGCPFGQGFHLGRPMSAEAACARVREQTTL